MAEKERKVHKKDKHKSKSRISREDATSNEEEEVLKLMRQLTVPSEDLDIPTEDFSSKEVDHGEEAKISSSDLLLQESVRISEDVKSDTESTSVENNPFIGEKAGETTPPSELKSHIDEAENETTKLPKDKNEGSNIKDTESLNVAIENFEAPVPGVYENEQDFLAEPKEFEKSSDCEKEDTRSKGKHETLSQVPEHDGECQGSELTSGGTTLPGNKIHGSIAVQSSENISKRNSELSFMSARNIQDSSVEEKEANANKDVRSTDEHKSHESQDKTEIIEGSVHDVIRESEDNPQANLESTLVIPSGGHAMADADLSEKHSNAGGLFCSCTYPTNEAENEMLPESTEQVSPEPLEEKTGKVDQSNNELSLKEELTEKNHCDPEVTGDPIDQPHDQQKNISPQDERATLEACISENAAQFFSSQQPTSCTGGLLSSSKVWTTTPEVVLEELTHVKPQTLSELHHLFPNQQQTLNQKYVDSFLMTIEQHEKQDFYDLVQTYYTSCNKLYDTNQDLDLHLSEQQKLCDCVWETVECTEAGSGECSDKAKVHGRIEYTKQVFSPQNAKMLSENLKAVRNLMHDPFVILSYEKHFAKLHVDAYLVDQWKRYPEWGEITSESSIEAHLEATPYEVESAAILKSSLSVLFAFQRKPVKDAEFTEVTRSWINRLVAILLRVGLLADHLYVLNQVLRCPAGIEKWAIQFVQMLPPPICVNPLEIFGHPLLDHYVHQLATLLMPIKGRKKLLYQMQKSVPEDASGAAWTLLDTDGEEEYDPSNSWYYLEESDLIALLNQLPLSAVMKHILFTVDKSTGKIAYDPESGFVEGNLRKLIAFATTTVNVLGDSLQVFGIPRFKQFHRRLVTMMRSLLCFVSEHMTNCQAYIASLPRSNQQSVQVEFDNLFFRVVSAFTCASGFSSWQYLTELPFAQLSETNIWKVLWKIYFLQESEFTASESLCTDEFCEQLCNFEKLSFLHEQLLSLETSAVLHLLSTFSTMACSRESYSLFVQTIVVEVYNLGYIDTRTRDYCCKQGREVLSMVCKKHPQAMADIFKCTCSNLTFTGKVSVFLYNGLPVWLWRPNAEEFETLGKWLSTSSLDSVENLLARTILEGLNWGLDSKMGDLFVKKQFHFSIMQAIVEAYKEHLPLHNIANTLTDKFCKTKAWKGTKDSKDVMALFLWKLAFQLDLNYSDIEASTVSISEFCMERHMDTDNRLKIEEYFSLVGGKCGRTVQDFCHNGICHLELLTEKPYALPAVHALSLILTRLHYPQQIQHLLSNQKFLNILGKLLTFDDTKSQLFAAEFPGPIRQSICELMMKHVHHREENSWMVEMGAFWLHSVTSLVDWSSSRGHAYVLNQLLMTTFKVPEFMDVGVKHFSLLYKNHQITDQSSGLLSSVVTWLARGSSGNSFPPLLQESYCSEFPYLMFFMLTAESLWENENALWKGVNELLQKNPDTGFDYTFLNKVVKALGIPKAPGIENLSIFRWAQLLISTDVSCPILPLICQKFFLLYLGRPQGPNVPCKSIGKRLFSQGPRVALLEKVTTKMTAAADIFQKIATSDTAKQGTCSAQDLQQQIQERDLHQNLTKFFRATVYWLSEPLLHESVVFVSDLPFHFEKGRLLSVLERDQNDWHDLVEWHSFHKEMHQMDSHWKDTYSYFEEPRDHKSSYVQKSATQKLFQRLNYDDVTEPPPMPETVVSPYPDVPLSLLQDKERLQYVVKSDLQFIAKQASEYCVNVDVKEELDSEYVEMLPDIFKVRPGTQTVVVGCSSMINPLHKCKGPASICVSYKGTVRDEIVNHKVNQNRDKHRQLQTICFVSPPQDLCRSLGNIEYILGEVIKQYRLSQNGPLEQDFEESGHCLYFILTSFVNKCTKYYPATRNFLTSCLEKLGEEFIIGKALQTGHLLQTLLKNKYLLDMISHHFLPNCNPDCFIKMYEDVTSHFMEDEYQVTVTLLTKFKVKQWLEHKAVGISQTRSLLGVTVDILGQFGKRPAKQITLLCELCRLNLVELMEFRFPQLYGDVLQTILNGGSAGKLMPVVWDDFVCSLLSGQSENQEVARIELLSFSQIKESIDVLNNHFHLLRLQSSDNTGIYPKWRAYITPLSSYMEQICKAFIQWRIKWLETSPDGNAAIMELWMVLRDLFRPWTGCYPKQNDLLFPWVEADKEPASSVVGVLIECVKVLHNRREIHQLDIYPLNLVWIWYIENMCRTNVPSFVQCVVQEQMSTLPWEDFQPTIDDLKTFTQEFARKNKKSCDFMTAILCRVQCTNFCQLENVTKSQDDQGLEMRTVHLCELFHILVMLPSCTIDQKEEVSRLLLSVEMVDWQIIEGDRFKHTAQCFTNALSSSSEFIQRSQPHAVALRMLKKASGMLSTDVRNLKNYQPKLACYVGSIAQIILKLSEENTPEKEQLKALLMNTLTDMESLSSLGDPDHALVSPLCVELFSAFNMCGSKKLLVIKEILLEWIAHSPKSALLLPLLSAGSRTIINIGCVVQQSEACMDSYFEGVLENSTASWSELLKHLQVPELNLPDFIQEALSCGAFLTLYTHVLQLLATSNTGETEIACLCNLVEWTLAVKSDASKEHKLLLWWWKILKLCESQTSVGIEPEETNTMLCDVMSSIWSLGEDRESEGFFGTLGFGKKSVFAVKFRVICKVLAMCINAVLDNWTRGKSKDIPPKAADSPTKSPDAKKVILTQQVAQIEKLLSSSNYGEYRSQLEAGLSFVQASDRTVKSTLLVMQSLVKELYPNVTYFVDIYG